MNTSRTLGRRRVATFSGPIWRGEQGWGAAAAGATAQTNARRRPHHTECLAQIDERSQRAKPYRPEESCVRGIILKANAASELTVNALESGILLPAARSLPGATRLAQCSRRLNRSRRLQRGVSRARAALVRLGGAGLLRADPLPASTDGLLDPQPPLWTHAALAPGRSGRGRQGMRRGRPFELLEEPGDASAFEVETDKFSAQASARQILEVEFHELRISQAVRSLSPRPHQRCWPGSDGQKRRQVGNCSSPLTT